ncbi:MAG: flagellar motor protein MotD [Gallionellaceae bacterium]|jgi:chemotaxis protein MotB
MKRINPHAEEEKHDRWLVSYADFITLLFAFFVAMYSISSLNEAKYRLFSDSIKIAFTTQAMSTAPFSDSRLVPITSTQPMSQTLFLNKELVDKRTAQLGKQQRKIEEQMKGLANSLNHVMASLIQQRKVNVNLTKRGVVMDISESTLFKSGEAVLQTESLDVLRSVAKVLSKEELHIEVEGHTDDTPIATARFPSNWELSSVRASSVVRILIDNGVPEKRLSVVGLASNQPLAPNTNVANRAKNRRVTITIASPNLDRE